MNPFLIIFIYLHLSECTNKTSASYFNQKILFQRTGRRAEELTDNSAISVQLELEHRLTLAKAEVWKGKGEERYGSMNMKDRKEQWHTGWIWGCSGNTLWGLVPCYRGLWGSRYYWYRPMCGLPAVGSAIVYGKHVDIKGKCVPINVNSIESVTIVHVVRTGNRAEPCFLIVAVETNILAVWVALDKLALHLDQSV